MDISPTFFSNRTGVTTTIHCHGLHIPVATRERAFNKDGSFRYKTEDRGRVLGMRGDAILVNVTRDAFLQARTGRLRLRILNVC